MSGVTGVSPLLRDYFRSKSQQILAASSEAVSAHTGLRGTHREEVVGNYLRHILPRRFEVGRGMISGSTIAVGSAMSSFGTP